MLSLALRAGGVSTTSVVALTLQVGRTPPRRPRQRGSLRVATAAATAAPAPSSAAARIVTQAAGLQWLRPAFSRERVEGAKKWGSSWGMQARQKAYIFDQSATEVQVLRATEQETIKGCARGSGSGSMSSDAQCMMYDA